MFERFVRIANVGVFDDYRHTGPGFERLTGVFAPNGSGKTTLVSIIRAMKEQAVQPVAERLTIGGQGSQLVNVRQNASTITFDGTTWSAPCDDVEVFDESFIDRNVHGDDGPQIEHRRAMYEVIIGEGGAELREEIVRLDQEIRATNQEIGQLERDLVAARGTMALEQFLTLAPDPEIDEKIRACEGELRALAQQGEIERRALLREVHLAELPGSQIAEVLARTLDGLSTEAEQRVRHRLSHRLAGAEPWLAQGAQLGTHEDCPFCGLSTEGNELILAYRGYFSEEYSRLRSDIGGAARGVGGAVGAEVVNGLLAAVQQNSQLKDFWDQHVTMTLEEVDWQRVTETCNETRDALEGLLAQKSSAPLEAATDARVVATAVERYSAVREEIGAYNNSVRAFNGAIGDLRARIGRVNTAGVQAALDAHRRTKVRHTQPALGIAQRLIEVRRLKADKDRAKVEARVRLDASSAALLQQYQESINSFLSMFGAGFQIGPIQENYIGGQPGCHFAIVIRNGRIPTHTAANAGSVRFKTALSTGDKRSLALAFFFAKLERCANLADVRVVLDDPVCSLDSARRHRTARHIVRLATRAKQVMLLSHDAEFLRLVWEEAAGPNVPRAGFTIIREAATAKLVAWDVMAETTPVFFKQLALLERFVETGAGDALAVKRALRPLLETCLRHRRPRAFQPNEWLGDMISRIRSAPAGDTLASLQPLMTDLTDVNSYTAPTHHGTAVGEAPETVDANELRSYCQAVIRIVCHN